MCRKRAAKIENWTSSFIALHDSFGLPLPRNQKISSDSKVNAAAEEGSGKKVYFTTTQERLKIIKTAHKELGWLLAQFLEADCLDWSLLLSLMLCEFELALDIISKDANLYWTSGVLQIFSHPHFLSYQKFRDDLEENLKSKKVIE